MKWIVAQIIFGSWSGLLAFETGDAATWTACAVSMAALTLTVWAMRGRPTEEAARQLNAARKRMAHLEVEAEKSKMEVAELEQKNYSLMKRNEELQQKLDRQSWRGPGVDPESKFPK